jgi:hypothetical protein
MSVSITELRISLVWTQTLPSLLMASGSSLSPLDLSRDDRYSEGLERARWVSLSPGSFDTPWPEVQGAPRLTTPWKTRGENSVEPNNFWIYYAHLNDVGQISSQRAWKLLVPLRINRSARFESTAADARCRLEGFVYPFGVAIILGVTLRGAFDLHQAVRQVADVRQRHSFVSDNSGAPLPMRLEALGSWAVGRLKSAVLNAAKTEEARVAGPFVVTTVVRGAGSPAELDPLQDVALVRTFDDLCKGTVSDPADPVDAAPSRMLAAKGGGANLIYRRRDARLVWAPSNFTKEAAKVRKLGCYHRNLVLASMQAEALLGVVAWAADYVSDRRADELTLHASDMAKNAANVLARLNGRSDRRTTDMYMSSSVAAQILQDSRREFIEAIRDQFGDGSQSALFEVALDWSPG